MKSIDDILAKSPLVQRMRAAEAKSEPAAPPPSRVRAVLCILGDCESCPQGMLALRGYPDASDAELEYLERIDLSQLAYVGPPINLTKLFEARPDKPETRQ